MIVKTGVAKEKPAAMMNRIELFKKCDNTKRAVEQELKSTQIRTTITTAYSNFKFELSICNLK